MNRRDAMLQLMAVGTSAWTGAARAESNRIVLGQSAPFSGLSAQLGIQMNKGARLYFDALNASGGINGYHIELRTLDDGYEPVRCKTNTETFVKSDVFAFFGYVGTPTSLAAMPTVLESKIPFFAPFTGAQSLRSPVQKTVFHLRASYYDETEVIIKQLTSLGLTRIAVFYQNDSYGKAGLEGVTRALASRKLEPVALGTVERNTVEVTQAVQDIVQKSPQAIVQISAYTSCAAFIRAARSAGYGGTFFNVSFVGTQALADELGKDGRGVMISQVMPNPYSATTPISAEYLEATRKAGPEFMPNYSSMEGYLAAKVFAEGVRRAGNNITRSSVIAGLESIRHVSFGGFNVNFGASDRVASNFVDLSMLTGDGKIRT